MRNRKQFILLLIVGLISLLAMSTIVAQDNNGNGKGGGNNGGGGSDNNNGNSSAVVEPTQNTDNGNHNGGGNDGNGNGNGGNQNTDSANTQQQETSVQQSDPLLGCQKNNPDRLDCSSLEVSGVCDGTTAVFIIRNTGEAGDGDMRAPTQYRLIVDGVVVETGSVQLTGGASGQITYSGGGSVTLEADQQVGHPGNSHPQVSLSCGAPPTQTAEPTEEITPTPEPTETVTPADPILTGEAICEEDGSILFVITNNGGDMIYAADYTVTDTNNNLVDNGSLQLDAGTQNFFHYWVNTGLIFTVGDLVVISDPTCAPSTPEITPPSTPDVTPTVEPTIGPDLVGEAHCQMDGTILFVIYNYGSDMTEAEYYTVTDSNNSIVDEGYLQVAAGQPSLFYFAGYPSLTFTMGNLVIVSPYCGTSTPEPTPEVTPPVDNSLLMGSVSCLSDGSIIFEISNAGDNMPDSAYFAVTDPDGALVADGWLQLMAGETTSLQYFGYSRLTFAMGALVISQDAECIPPTPEVTPTPEPTQEVTPTVEPTEEVTPTVEPTQTGKLGCQKNNPDRSDCSSLQVTATCQAGVAVFTVRNTGEAGEGDMISATQYRIIVDDVVVETSTVQLLGNTSIQITYSGTGTVTLEADQQTGHPGGSQPQATVNCSA